MIIEIGFSGDFSYISLEILIIVILLTINFNFSNRKLKHMLRC